LCITFLATVSRKPRFPQIDRNARDRRSAPLKLALALQQACVLDLDDVDARLYEPGFIATDCF